MSIDVPPTETSASPPLPTEPVAPPKAPAASGLASAMFGGAAGASWIREPRKAWAELNQLLAPVGMWPLLVLLGVSVTERFDNAAFGLLGPQVRDAFHLSNASYLAITGISGLLPVFLSAHVGYLTDRTKRTRLGAIGAGVWALTAILTGLAPTLLILVVARLLGGMGSLVNTPVHQSLIADYYKPEALAPTFSFLLIAASGVGLIAGPVAGVVGQIAGWRATFVLLALPTFFFVYLTIRLREPARGESLGVDYGSEQNSTFGEGYRRVKAIRSLRRTWAAAAFFGGGVIAFGSLSNLYFADVYHLSPAQRGFLAPISGLAGLIGLGFGGMMAQRVMRAGRPELLPVINGLCIIESAVGMVLMALAPNVVLAVASVALLTLGLTAYSPSFTIMSAIVAPPRLRAQAISYTLLFTVIGGILIQPTIGYIGDSIGERKALVILGLMVGVAGAVETTVRRFVRRDVAEAVKLTTAAESDSMLTVRGLDVAYEGGVQVLFGVDFDVAQGEVIALLGTNGAGKSTLLRAISGLMDPIGGAIFFDGRDITHADATQKAALGIVQVPGGRGVFPGLSVGENLRLAGWLFRKDPAYLRDATERVLGYFPILREFWDRPAADLSGGQQQMLTLAQSLLAKPKLLMIDELSLGLAPVIVEQLLDVVRQLAKDGTTIVLVEQSVNVALNVADKAYFMEKGEVRFSGPTRELLERPDVLRSVFLEGAASRDDLRAGAGAANGHGHAHANGNGQSALLPAQPRKVAIGEGAEVALSVRGLSKRFGGVQAVDDVSFDLYRHQILGIIGPNGAGKTTLFDIISGFTQADEGTIVLEGLNVTSFGADTRARLGLGRSFQDARLFPSLTVRDTIALSLERRLEVRDPVAIALNVPEVVASERKITERVNELIDLMRLGAFRDKFISELSTGSRRIVDLACVLAHEPSVVLFDEPSSGIAQRETEALGPLLQRIRRASDASLLVIEHDMPLIASISDELIALDLGSFVTRGTPQDVQNDPRVIASYLGTSNVVVNRSGIIDPSAALDPSAPGAAARPRRPRTARRPATSTNGATNGATNGTSKTTRTNGAAKPTTNGTRRAPRKSE